MFGKNAFAFFFVLFSASFAINFASGSRGPPTKCNFFSSKPVPYDTPSPINVITKDAIHIPGNSSVFLRNALLTPLTTVNTGYTLQGHGYPFELGQIITSGGVLCDQTYQFHEVRFYISDDPKTSSFTQIDGKGSPITLSVIYYNVRYKSFNESLNHRDGLVMYTLQLDFSPEPNPIFYLVEILLYLLREPGSQMTIPAGVAYAWFDRLPFIKGYYAFYDSYIDLVTGKQYPCAINILADRNIYVLSKRQFYESFPKLKNRKGGKLVYRQPVRKRGRRPIYRGIGFDDIYPLI